MRVLLASSEAVPFAKTGGLADVATGLSKALAELGHDVTLVLPYYRQHVPPAIPVERTTTSVAVPIADRLVSGGICRASLPGSQVRVLLIDHPHYFDRSALYTAEGQDYADNCERFVFFSRAVLEAARVLDLQPDVIHVNDWQTGLVPAYLSIEYRGRHPGFERTAAIITVHNIAFQGRFWLWDMRLTGLDWRYFNPRQMEFWGDINLLKTGIVFSDLVTTVSPTYAKEICTPEYGCGLEGVLAERGDDLVGILNGVDTSEWDPATDKHIPHNYSVENWSEGKAACKRHLQSRFGLNQRSDAPLFGMISRLTDQKGLDLIAARTGDLLGRGAQIVFLGTGEARYEQFVRSTADGNPRQVAAVVGFNEGLAHQIEAGADLYLMPSRFEPCGLNQQYSMRYGTVPIVHAVGGLADSVVDVTVTPWNGGRATGFVFRGYDAATFAAKTEQALDVYGNRRTWDQMVRNGMTRDCSWAHSAAEYVAVYERARARHR
jgi:starch synthase